MLVGGADGPNLAMLASAQPPLNPFEFDAVRDCALAEAGEAPMARADALRRYAAERFRSALGSAEEGALIHALRSVAEWYTFEDVVLQDAYLLRCAWEDLESNAQLNVPWHWPTTSRGRILSDIREYAQRLVRDVDDARAGS